MPFVSNMPSDEEQQKVPSQGAVPATGGAPMQLSPSSGVVGAGSSTGKPAAPAGGQFASLNQYITANQEKAQPLANQLTSGIGQQYQNLEGQNKQTISNIGGQVTSQPDYSKANETIAAESANPASFTSNPSNVTSFQNLLKASYAGPASAESTSDFANQQNAINKAISQGQSAVQTEAGRENLIASNQGRQGAGVTALNSAILSQDPNALASVEGAYKPFQNLITGLQSGAADVNKQIADRQAQATAAKNAATSALTSQIGALNTNVGNEVTSAQQALAAQNAQIKADLASGNPSDASLKALGVTRDQWNSLSTAQKAAATSQNVYSNKGQFGALSGTTNLDLSNFLTQGAPTTAVTAENAATAADYAKAQAFQNLLGGLDLGTPTMAINPNAAKQAGTAPTNLNTFDYQAALNTATQAKTDQIAAAQAYVDALQSGADEEHAQLAAQEAAKRSQIADIAMFTPLGLPAAATTAVVAGAPTAAKTYLQKMTSTNPVQMAANVLTGGLAPVAQGVGAGIQKAVNTVTHIFCFHPDTLITMENGSLLPIHQIVVGDMTKGGKVLATTRAIGQDFYWYNGVIVTGKHAVKEEGIWVRVENAKMAHKFKYLTEVVCNLVTEKHRIFSNGIEFADQYETDMYESLDMDESLRELNRNAEHLG